LEAVEVLRGPIPVWGSAGMGVLSIEIVTAGFSLENYQYVFYVAE
jgi:hypothetical protein